MKFLVELTTSQRLALLDVLIHAISGDAPPTVYVDCSQSPPVETALGDLLTLVNEARVVQREGGVL